MCSDAEGGTALDDAIRIRSEPLFKLFVRDYGIQLACTQRHCAVLIDAAHKDDVQLLRMLTHSGINPNCHVGGCRTPLHLAVAGGATAAVKALLDTPGIKLGPVDVRGHTPLWDALVARNATMASMLRKAGAPLQAGIASSMCQAASTDDAEFIILLANVGIDLSLKVCCSPHVVRTNVQHLQSTTHTAATSTTPLAQHRHEVDSLLSPMQKACMAHHETPFPTKRAMHEGRPWPHRRARRRHKRCSAHPGHYRAAAARRNQWRGRFWADSA